MVQKIATVVLIFLASMMQVFASAKEKKPVLIQHEFVVHAPMAQAWQVLGPEFENAYKWAASVSHSEARDKNSFHGSSCTERGCDVSGIGKVKEKLLLYSEAEHTICYQVYEGMPSMVKYAANTWKLTDNQDGTCKVAMTIEMKTGGMMGAMMKGMMKMKMTKLSKEIGEEFCYYVENSGRPHPRKIKAQMKSNH